MPEYKYKGYTIRQVNRPSNVTGVMMQWDIFDAVTLLKRGFSSLDIAKHYIDVCMIDRRTANAEG